MASNSTIPEIPEDQKFDGGMRLGWLPVKRRITSALRAQGLTGYIDGSIIEPSSTSSSNLSSESSSSTAVYSTNPSLGEWSFRNNRAKQKIEAHVDDLTFLIPNADSLNAHELIQAFDSEYAAMDEMRKVLAERKLRSYVFRGGESIEQFFNNIQTYRKEAVKAGSEIDDSTFRQIILAAFPSREFDTIIQTVSSSPQNKTSASVIQHITFSYSRVENRDSRSSIGGDQISHLASRVEEIEKRLGAQFAAKGLKNNKECSNCGRKGHTKEECYRKGGGKEGEYPSWWRGKRESMTPSTANMSVTEFPQHYATLASRQGDQTAVYAGSAASDHFFRDRSNFITYEPYHASAQSSEQNTNFEIVGRGRAQKTLYEGGKKLTLTFENALHAPDITSDLISVGRLDQLGYQILFGNGQARFFSPKGVHFLTGYGSGRLYRLIE